MKKIIQLLTVLLSIIFIGCNQKQTFTIYYPSEEIVNDLSSVTFVLDTITMNFKEFDNQLYKLDEQNKQIIIEFLDEDTVKKVKINSMGFGTFYEKNILSIENDSVIKDKKYPLSELKEIMKRHYFNHGKIQGYSDSPDKAIVLINFKDNQQITDLKKYLIAITRTFDEINKNDLKLNIFIGGFVPPPTPPPAADEPIQMQMNK